MENKDSVLSGYLGVLIIDELDKLKMSGEGLEPVIEKAIAKFIIQENKNSIIIIIKEALLNDTIESLGVQDAEVIDTEQL